MESLPTALATGSDPPDTVRLRLLHAHLPKLHDAAVIDYDPDERTVRRGPEFDAIAALLDALDDARDPVPEQVGSEGEWRR